MSLIYDLHNNITPIDKLVENITDKLLSVQNISVKISSEKNWMDG